MPKKLKRDGSLTLAGCTVYLVIEETPDYNNEITVYAERSHADAHAKGALREYAKLGVKLTNEEGIDVWINDLGTVSVEVRKVTIS